MFFRFSVQQLYQIQPSPHRCGVVDSEHILRHATGIQPGPFNINHPVTAASNAMTSHGIKLSYMVDIQIYQGDRISGTE